MIRTTLLIPLVAILLSCGLSIPSQDDEPQEARPSQMPPTVAQVSQSAPPTGGSPQLSAGVTAAIPLSPHIGDALIEEKIIENDIIVKATMTLFSSEVAIVTDVLYGGSDNRYSPVFKFNLNADEYLKGTGPSSIVGVWIDGRSYETNDEASDALSILLAERDDQWDAREGIFFLVDGVSGFGTALDTLFQRTDHFLLGKGDPYSPDDQYGLHSGSYKAWLPEVSPVVTTGDAQEFLMDVPPTTKTITLGALKQRIESVAAELAGGDGSDAYRECIIDKYRQLRNQQNSPEEMGRPYTSWQVDHSIASGLSAGSVLTKNEVLAAYPDDGSRMPISFGGADAALFNAENSDPIGNVDRDKDGEYDYIRYETMIKYARPLPGGEYRFALNESEPAFSACGYVVSNEWTVTVAAPVGSLHEFFFDPVTDGAAVAADATNGVLKPATFTDANDAAAAISRIEWESGAVKMTVNPHTGLTGHFVDFIELDGTVSLSLAVSAGTVDAANNALSWSVTTQPWHDGDLLMVRIREP